MSDRKAAFDTVVADCDEKALTSTVDFKAHRFISIERDAQTVNRYVKGHETLRGACDYLSRATEEGEPYVPEQIVDLDSGKSYELELFAFVAPKVVDPIAVMMPRKVAATLAATLDDEPRVWRDDSEGLRLRSAADIIEQALNRRVAP